MSETYKFYVQMDGEVYGPYSARGIKDLNLELHDDILVTEESMNGQWYHASKFDFDDMVRKETGYVPELSPAVGVINADGTVTNPKGWRQNTINTEGDRVGANVEDNSTPVGWCILSFFLPIVGWILYFNWRRTKPRKASAVCVWAWIGFAFNIIMSIAGF